MQYYYMKIKAETKKHNDIFGGNDDYDGGYGGGQYDGSECSFIMLILLSFSLFSFQPPLYYFSPSCFLISLTSDLFLLLFFQLYSFFTSTLNNLFNIVRLHFIC